MNWNYLRIPLAGVLCRPGRPVLSIAVAVMAVACGGSHGKMRTDTPALPYQNPDISEITGIPEPEPSEEVAPDAPAPAAAPTSVPPSPSVVKPAPAATAPAGNVPPAPKR